MQAPAASSCFSNYMATTRERTALASLKISMSNGVSVKSVLMFVEGDMRNESGRNIASRCAYFATQYPVLLTFSNLHSATIKAVDDSV